jgi:large subunit ribosomal protein L4
MVVNDILLPEPKTKRMVEFLSRLELGDNVLVVIHEENPSIERAARNLPRVKVLRSEGLNVYDLLRYRQTLFTQEALRRVSERLGS